MSKKAAAGGEMVAKGKMVGTARRLDDPNDRQKCSFEIPQGIWQLLSEIHSIDPFVALIIS